MLQIDQWKFTLLSQGLYIYCLKLMHKILSGYHNFILNVNHSERNKIIFYKENWKSNNKEAADMDVAELAKAICSAICT